MEIAVERRAKKAEYTIGRMYLNGERFCDTLEDAVRMIAPNGAGKIKGKTAIPAGRYFVTMTMSPKFKRVLPLLHKVPHFDGVRIHRGNTAKDTEGCILVGENKAVGKVLNSRQYEERLVELLLTAQAAGDEIWIDIR